MRLALTRKEAASSLGVSLTFLEERIQPELAVVRRGNKVLIAVSEIERWLCDQRRERTTING